MAGLTLDKRTGNYLVNFRYGGQKFLVSSKTKNRGDAQRFKGRVEDTLQLLDRGHITMPPDADARLFITSGGKLAEKPRMSPNCTLTEARVGYLADQQSKAESTMVGERIHIRHLIRILGESTKLSAITTASLQEYVNKRRKQKRRGKPTSGPTIKKELVTFTQIWAWAKRRGYVRCDCPVYDENRKWAIQFPKAPEKEKFQTWGEIASRIDRGGLTEIEQADLWASLFLDNAQVIELLDYVKTIATHPFVYPMFVFAAYTGARRSEVCRSRVEDFDFDRMRIRIRERKRKRSKSESVRFVDMHPRLSEVMKKWFAEHPGGPYAIAIPLKMQKRKTRTEFSQMSPREAHYHFKEPLVNSKWKVLSGWHVLRHSFGSNLARAGVSRDRIAEWMGHSTEEMKELYQHLFPQDGASQIAALV